MHVRLQNPLSLPHKHLTTSPTTALFLTNHLTRTLTTNPPTPEKPKRKPVTQIPPRPTLPDHDLKHKYLKGSGPGGQKINKTSSAVQLTHLPTGIVVKSQATRSRSQNHTIARRILAEKIELIEKGDESRVARKMERKQKKKASAAKKRRRKYRKLEEGNGDGVSVGVGDGLAAAVVGSVAGRELTNDAMEEDTDLDEDEDEEWEDDEDGEDGDLESKNDSVTNENTSDSAEIQIQDSSAVTDPPNETARDKQPPNT